jgi:hypothetical protein
MMNYHRFFEKNVFYFLPKLQKSAKKSKKYFTYISIKIDSILKTFFTKMISAKISRNPESFNGFGGGRRKDWRFPMDTPIYMSKLTSQFKNQLIAF